MKEHEKELLSRCAAYELANNFDYVPNFEELFDKSNKSPPAAFS